MRVIVVTLLISLCAMPIGAAPPAQSHQLTLRLTIETAGRHVNTPMDPLIDFGAVIVGAGVGGVLDLDSINVFSVATSQIVPHALSSDFNTGDQGRIEFVVADPEHSDFEIHFRTVSKRSPREPQTLIPQIGAGDLLRFNAPVPRPIAVPYSPGLHDLNGDGQLDLTGTWNYAYRPGEPWDAVICFPRITDSTLQFGDLQRPRFVSDAHAEPRVLSHTYMAVDFADFNHDGRLDLVMTGNRKTSATFYLNTGEHDPGGMPQFAHGGSVAVTGWQACRAVDLNNDGAPDLVVDGEFVRNDNPDGWPFRAAASVQLNAGRKSCFLDIDGDGWRDAICLQGGESVQPDFYRVAWRRNTGKSVPEFADEQVVDEIALPETSFVSAWNDAGRSGLIVQHNSFQEISVYELNTSSTVDNTSGRRQFQRSGRAESQSAVMSCSDQAWPCLCDWDDDGDQDLLIGGGYGWPRIVINEGTRKRPVFREPARILADGETIRLVRNEILGKPNNWHDMGYSFPVFVDWDSDGLNDLICPNETNRIFWYKNIGTRTEPRFASRRQILCDGYPDSAVQRSRSNQRANDPKSNNGVYPFEQDRPFLWRTGTAVADFNSDGLMDLVTHDGHTRVATLFVQYHDDNGVLRLRKDRVLRLADGRPINDAIVDRRAHWTESFRAVDWDQDGLQDLIYSVAGAHNGTKDGGSIYLLTNVGSSDVPLFAAPQTMRCFGEPIRITNHGPHPWPGDFDGDGRPDLITCVEWSVYPYYSHTALAMSHRPQYTIELIHGDDSANSKAR